MQREYRLYIDDILEAIEKIERYTQSMSFEDFKRTPVVVDAVLRNLEIIGEAAKHIPTDIKRAHKDIEWKKVAGVRDILIHEYFGVNLPIVWDIVINKIPELKESVKQILNESK